MYPVFTRKPGESYRRRLRSLLLYLCDVFRALINSLVCSSWYNRNGWLGVKHQVTYLLTLVFWYRNSCQRAQEWGPRLWDCMNTSVFRIPVFLHSAAHSFKKKCGHPSPRTAWCFFSFLFFLVNDKHSRAVCSTRRQQRLTSKAAVTTGRHHIFFSFFSSPDKNRW